MRNFSTVFLVLLCAVFFSSETKAQEYKTAIGARLGSPLSASYKTFFNESGAFEVYAGTRGRGTGDFRWRWYNISAAYQHHMPLDIADLDGLTYYFGGGGTVYFWTFGDAFVNNESNTSFGVQGYLGLSYTLPDHPVNFTIDWIPTFFLNGYTNGFGARYYSAGIRYVIGR